MNIGMKLNESNNEDIIMYQNRIKHILLNLRDKRRKLRNPDDDEIDEHSNKWNRYNRHFLLPVQESVGNSEKVYPLHNALELRETDEQTEEMLQHLSQLQRLAYEYVDYIFPNILRIIFFIFSFLFVTGIHAKWETCLLFVNYVKRKCLAYCSYVVIFIRNNI